MSDKPDDICPRIDRVNDSPTHPASPPIYPTSVWQCEDPQQAYEILEGHQPGYVYQRGDHPNADVFAEKIKQLHGAECVAVASSGMGAMVTAALSQLQSGDHIVISNQLYGESSIFFRDELSRTGITCDEVDTCNLEATASVLSENTKLLVVETITNPLLRVTDISALADLCHSRGIKLLVDNTFATPVICQPLALGADFVMESVSKMINGHTDVMLGVLCGGQSDWQRVPRVLRTWGLASSPWDCWLATRGMATLHLRIQQAAQNAMHVAQWLSDRKEIERVDYPGLDNHPDRELAKRQLKGGSGNMLTFHLRDGRHAADSFIKAAHQIPFCPSLGEACTTLSHPQSTSHRALSEDRRLSLGITGGTIRLSVGIESADFIQNALSEGLESLG